MSEKKKIPTRDLSVEVMLVILELSVEKLEKALEENERAQRISPDLWERQFTI